MLQIDRAILSDDVLETEFACDLQACKGACCVEGDGGAPLETEEISRLESHLADLLPMMSPEGREAVRQHGVFTVDQDGDMLTTLTPDGTCAFACSENGILHCVIEQAQRNGVIRFAKPVSCHLYPIRITRYPAFDAVNVHRWDICSCGYACGHARKIPLYVFLKDALIRKYGEEWYEKLCIAADYFIHQRGPESC